LRVEREGGEVVCERCELAVTVRTRMKGLLGRKELPVGKGLWIRPASSIHMFFMRFPIDAVFLNGDMEVLSVRRELPAWRMAAGRGARAVLELRAGEAARRGVAPGARLRVVAGVDHGA
jgi:uncharacterized protein